MAVKPSEVPMSAAWMAAVKAAEDRVDSSLLKGEGRVPDREGLFEFYFGHGLDRLQRTTLADRFRAAGWKSSWSPVRKDEGDPRPAAEWCLRLEDTRS